jgi:hypothetical protein
MSVRLRIVDSMERGWGMSGYPEARGHLEVKSVSEEGEANHLLAQGWELFTVVAGGGEHLHFILTRRAA